MGTRHYTTQVSLQMEEVKQEIRELITAYENLALQINKTKEIKEIKEDANLLKNVKKNSDRIIDQIKIVIKKLNEINGIFFDRQIDSLNMSIENFFEKAVRVIQDRQNEKLKAAKQLGRAKEILQKI